MTPPVSPAPTRRRLAIAVRGVVQGVGFRPFVYNTARAAGLTGWVLNEADNVRIEVQGAPDALDAFIATLRHGHPPQAKIDAIDVRETSQQDEAAFTIRTGAGSAKPRPTVPADLATCAACLAEIRTDDERRYRYPFTNCTNCGPRWSIVESLPYDRPRTSMARFSMCADCRAEYEDPTDRRFHAQPIACPACGPMLRLVDRQGAELAAGDDALRAAVDAVRAGQVVALRGLGGFQLVVDATQADAVARLRQRKQRPDKPLALMARSVDEVRRWCEVSEEEARALGAPEAPIMLLRRRSEDRGTEPEIAAGVAPGSPYLGVMLPYTPLHHLLLDAVDRPIVCTSGNLSEEPMATDIDDALVRLGSIADVFLTHQRPIVRPVDDSVARLGPDGELQVLRRARGFAPLPLELPQQGPTVVAVGGHLKNTVALGLGGQVILSPHVGDLEDVLSVEVHRRAVRDLVEFFDATPEVVACDLHPDYASTRYAEALAARWDVPLVRVQHHHAHVAACMAEHRLEGPVLGLAWDGTGYGRQGRRPEGAAAPTQEPLPLVAELRQEDKHSRARSTDGTVWGGEMLLCEGAAVERVGHLRTFPLPGGDKAVRQPRRSALGLLFAMLGAEAAQYVVEWFAPTELKSLLAMLARGVGTPETSSMGRLFDAVAALCGLPGEITFEGQAAMALEFAAAGSHGDTYPMELVGAPSGATAPAGPMVVDWEPAIRAVLADRAAGVPVGEINARFHNGLADMAATVAKTVGCRQVALSGGCFQNALLTDRVRERLLERGFSVYTHRQVPPGDGGIALGQVFVAAQELQQ